jgi:hypothetical protein
MGKIPGMWNAHGFYIIYLDSSNDVLCPKRKLRLLCYFCVNCNISFLRIQGLLNNFCLILAARASVALLYQNTIDIALDYKNICSYND